MAAYASAARTAQAVPLRLFSNNSRPEQVGIPAPDGRGGDGLDVVLAHLADLVAERLMACLSAPVEEADEWLDTRKAAEYLGVHRDTIRRLAAERVIPSEQEGAGCKLYFRRKDLDTWRCSGRRLPEHLAAPGAGS
ncbi:MAG TPA: helix-turn-helix domain-containing protein [Solirubrobacteraceae bacterium]|nr:helix-turn-helix domain-containing protein [Solirubrobacteraceae bacterium]